MLNIPDTTHMNDMTQIIHVTLWPIWLTQPPWITWLIWPMWLFDPMTHTTHMDYMTHMTHMTLAPWLTQHTWITWLIWPTWLTQLTWITWLIWLMGLIYESHLTHLKCVADVDDSWTWVICRLLCVYWLANESILTHYLVNLDTGADLVRESHDISSGYDALVS